LIDRLTILTWAQRVLALALFVGILVALTDYAPAWRRPAAPDDPVGRMDALLEPLRSELGDHPVVGLVTDRNSIGVLFRAQFALAPSLVLPLEPVPGLRAPSGAPEFERVVGLFERPGSAELAMRRHGLKRIRAVGPGVVLFGFDR